jgi:uncharacterized protein with NRDE domain
MAHRERVIAFISVNVNVMGGTIVETIILQSKRQKAAVIVRSYLEVIATSSNIMVGIVPNLGQSYNKQRIPEGEHSTRIGKRRKS